MQCYEKYLGLLALIGRNRTRAFQALQSCIWDRLQGWNEKFLSQAGKEVLLKAVIAIPTYMMSIFQLPTSLCCRINSTMSRFWWGHKDNLSEGIKVGVGLKTLKFLIKHFQQNRDGKLSRSRIHWLERFFKKNISGKVLLWIRCWGRIHPMLGVVFGKQRALWSRV
jgi:hypothetical protein